MAEARKAARGGRGGTGSESGFMKLLTPSSELAAIVGHEPLPRTEATKRVWDYIKEHKLQNSNDKRTIIADHKLKAILGGKASVTMFELPKHLASHLGGGVIVPPRGSVKIRG
jgi:upstream activation factor subunit UAF30